jgi:Holliday junction resolvasome RuvABC endonuclease subunit
MPPDSSQVVSIIGIDPGSHCLGVGVLKIDITTLKIVSSDAWTLVGKRLVGKNDWTTSIHGERNGRVYALEQELLRIFRYFQPLEIASESPFINSKFPQAGLALTVVVCGIRQAVMQYDVWRELHLIDPPTVKMAVGAAGNAPKEVVKEKIMLLPNLNYIGTVPLSQLDEHSIDALAVAFARFRLLMEKLCLCSPHFSPNTN